MTRTPTKMNKIPLIKIAFDPRTGDLLEMKRDENIKSFTERDPKTPKGYINIPIIWKNNFSFIATLRVHFWHTNLNPYLIVQDIATNAKYYMKLKDFIQVTQERSVTKGEMTGEWTFHSSGGKVGITPFDP